MTRKIFYVALGALLFALCCPAEAQQPKKVSRIGFFSYGSVEIEQSSLAAFQQGLRELGYLEGQNIVIEQRYAEGTFDRLPALAAELVDIIITTGPAPTRAAKGATVTIPIVMTQVGDPVGSGFVTSLARPDGNIRSSPRMRIGTARRGANSWEQ